MSELPVWVYDVVMELDRWREFHPKLYAEYLDLEKGGYEKKRVDDCGCKAIEHVPADMLARAKAISAYLAARELAAEHDSGHEEGGQRG